MANNPQGPIAPPTLPPELELLDEEELELLELLLELRPDELELLLDEELLLEELLEEELLEELLLEEELDELLLEELLLEPPVSVGGVPLYPSCPSRVMAKTR